MTVTARVLLESKSAEATQTKQIDSTGMRTIIDKFTAYNSDPAAQALTVYLVPAAGSSGAGNISVVKTLQPGETYTFPEVVGHILESGASLNTLAAKAGVINLRASGRVVS